MLHLSAFADEIAIDLETQVEVLLSEHIHHVEFRSAWGINVLDLSDQQLGEVQRIFEAREVSVAALGSPIGKVPIDQPFEEHLQRFERALAVARALHTVGAILPSTRWC
jgi:3-dehydroshikimate dehydratase